MFNKNLFVLCFLLLFLVSPGCSKTDTSEYNYITPEELNTRLNAGEIAAGSLLMVSSQTEDEWASGHLSDAFPSFSRPLTEDAHFAKLDPFLDIAKNADADIIIICPRGGSGATRPFDYFLENGISKERLLILEGGQEAYNDAFPEDVVTGQG
ncbi:rhodanese-like domain-containing protein [Desulfonatronovibrio magnus]|uniref:rhodanese-like domain-containing protein n=1 Tax=Desulfonatronovibrio magnus TaxID=698827 RepID=UPI0005EB4170|nr:rhodanese-like domain-containing protein [Desulfonatronovibrio magnus]